MELKYKVWDKEQEKFLRIDDEDKGCANPNYYRDLYFTLNGEKDKDGYPYQIDGEILPYTGVKDINKKESYLGDILKDKLYEYSRKKDIEKRENSFGIVKKEVNSNNLYLEWNFKRKYQDEYYWGTNNLSITHIEEHEIVGNIYENPDMIKKD